MTPASTWPDFTASITGKRGGLQNRYSWVRIPSRPPILRGPPVGFRLRNLKGISVCRTTLGRVKFLRTSMSGIRAEHSGPAGPTDAKSTAGLVCAVIRPKAGEVCAVCSSRVEPILQVVGGVTSPSHLRARGAVRQDKRSRCRVLSAGDDVSGRGGSPASSRALGRKHVRRAWTAQTSTSREKQGRM